MQCQGAFAYFCVVVELQVECSNSQKWNPLATSTGNEFPKCRIFAPKVGQAVLAWTRTPTSMFITVKGALAHAALVTRIEDSWNPKSIDLKTRSMGVGTGDFQASSRRRGSGPMTKQTFPWETIPIDWHRAFGPQKNSIEPLECQPPSWILY